MTGAPRHVSARGALSQAVLGQSIHEPEANMARKSSPLNTDDVVDYKDVRRLQRFLTERGKILPRRATGLSAKQQRQVSRAIKRARQIALIPYVKRD